MVDTVGENLGAAFPEILVNPELVKEVINEEEKLFLRTLVRGQRVLEKKISSLPKDSSSLPGEIVWLMYDTFGFPMDLTALMAEENSLKIDEAGFEKARDAAIELSKQGGKTVDQSITLDVHALDFLQKSGVAATDASYKYDYTWQNDHYECPPISAKILKIRYNWRYLMKNL